MGNGPDPAELLAIAVTVAEAAAELAVARRAEGLGVVGTKSTATDPVTAADRAVERLIGTLLREHRPDDRLLGEEFGAGERVGPAPKDDRQHDGAQGDGAQGDGAQGDGAQGDGAGSVRWIVDPIDGTVNYVYGLPHYAVSIAAELDGMVVAGVVRNAVTGEQWTATRGGGAWRGSTRLAGSTVTELGRALIGTGFGYDSARRAHQAGVLPVLLARVRDIRRFGAASLDLCFAAEGRFDAYFEKGLAAWDRAAGALVATEAGLLVTGLRGAPPGPDLVLAAPPGLYPELHDLLVQLDADGGP
jgi:myo-inositol-1(or 4)-monophosphatase